MFKKIPPKVKLLAGCGAAATVIDKVQDNGISRVSVSHKSFKEAFPSRLPAENFELQKQIEAGVKLEQVDTQVLTDNINEVVLPLTFPSNEENDN